MPPRRPWRRVLVGAALAILVVVAVNVALTVFDPSKLSGMNWLTLKQQH